MSEPRKALSISIVDIMFVKPEDVKPEDEVIDDIDEKSKFLNFYALNLENLQRLWAQYKSCGPTKERTVCIRRTVQFKPSEKAS